MRKSFFLPFLFLSACATGPDYSIQGVSVPSGNLVDVVEKWTSEETVYHGMITAFQVSATMHSTDVIEQQVYNQAARTHRSSDQYQDALKKANADTQDQTFVFVSLFTDRDEDNDLDKPKTAWNVFLDIDGRRISPKQIKRIFENKEVLQEKYPHLNHWGKRYMITFPVRIQDIQTRQPVLTMAGPLGAVRLHFPN